MGVELQKELFSDGGSQIEPPAHARCRGQVIAGKLADLQARHQASGEAQAERAGDHQEVAAPAAADRSFNAVIEGAGTIAGVVRTPVDLDVYKRQRAT